MPSLKQAPWRARVLLNKPQAQIWAVLVVINVLVITLGVEAYAWVSAERAEADAQAQLAGAIAAAGQSRASAKPPTRPRNFALALGDLPSSQQAVEAVHGSAQQAATAINALRVVERAPTTERLARLELAFELKASYPAIKATLANTMESLDHATLSRLQLQADPAGHAVTAQLVLHIWGAPLDATPAAPTR